MALCAIAVTHEGVHGAAGRPYGRKEELALASLCEAGREVVAGILGSGEADLGQGLFKKRLARRGAGKRGGYRAIVAYRAPRTDRVLFAYVFAKNAASTLTPQGHAALAKAGASFVSADEEQVQVLLGSGDVIEVNCNDSA